MEVVWLDPVRPASSVVVEETRLLWPVVLGMLCFVVVVVVVAWVSGKRVCERVTWAVGEDCKMKKWRNEGWVGGERDNCGNILGEREWKK